MTKDDTYQIGATTQKTSFFKNNTQKPNYQKNKPINKKFNTHQKNERQNNRSQSFNRNQSKDSERNQRKPFNRQNNRSFKRNDKKPFNRNEKRPFNKGDKRPFNRNDNKSFQRTNRKPYNRDQRKPFNRNNQRKPYSKNDQSDRQADRSNNFSKSEFKEQRKDRNLKYQERQHRQKKNQQLDDQNKNRLNGQKTQVKDEKQKVEKIKHNRVIIRNLVFDINVNHLKKLLSPFGQILDVHIPQNPDGKGSRGFAFIEFKNRNNALKAIKQLNGTQFKGRTIVLDESISKQKYLQSRINEEENLDKDNKIQQQAKQKIKLQETNKKQKLEMQSQQQNNQQQQLSNQDQQDQDDDENEEEEDKVKNQNVKHQGSKRQKTESQILQDISSEVFIRNLPITVNQQTLHSFFRKYGKLKFAKVVVNKQTGLSKGSAFLKFEDPQKAKQLVQYSRSYEMNLLGKNPNFKVNAGINLQLQGTVLKLFPVESRQNITEKVKGRQEKDAKREQLKKQQEKKKKPIKKVKSLQKLIEYDPNDKRNLKLALLGLNKVTEQMREKDQQRFRNHQKQKLQKLKNPNNSVSDTRIVLKYLNKEITEQDIRNLCLQFLDQNNHKANALTYCKLMLESLQTKKSAGFAFVEFKTHQIALQFLQWIAQQPTKLMRDPFICQFAIQDSRKLQRLQNRNNSSKSTTKTQQVKKNKPSNKNKGKKNGK